MEETCQSNSLDWSSLVIILFYFSLQLPASPHFSVIFQPISLKFGMLIVLHETNRLNIFASQWDQGSGQGVVTKFYYAL